MATEPFIIGYSMLHQLIWLTTSNLDKVRRNVNEDR